MDWNDVIEIDQPEYCLIEPGDYFFKVIGLERGRHDGSKKIPPCKKAIVTLEVTTDNGKTNIVKEQLLLHHSLEWKLSSFFRAIGQKLRGQRLKMNWDTVVGSQGRAHFNIRTVDDKKFNYVDKYYDYDALLFPEDERIDMFEDFLR